MPSISIFRRKGNALRAVRAPRLRTPPPPAGPRARRGAGRCSRARPAPS